MVKFRLFIIILTVFIYAKNVYGVLCYVSDFENIKSGNIKKLNHTLLDCNNYNNEVKQLIPKLQVPENETLNCYTVEVSKDVSVRGCTQRGGCNFLIDVVKNIARETGALDSNDATRKTRCTECGRNTCNGIQSEYLQLEPTPFAVIEEPRGERSLKCHQCLEPCEVAEAREKICGQNIGKSHEAVCSLQVSKEDNDPLLAVRKCEVVQKDNQPACPENSVCTFCRSDLCNKDVGEASLKCYSCTDACEVSKATERTCGQTIGGSQEAVCTTEMPKDTKTPTISTRKCQIVAKGSEPTCPANSVCTACKSDLCNSAPSTVSSMALVGIAAAFFVFLLN